MQNHMADISWAASFCIAQERVEIEWTGEHYNRTIGVARPFLFRTIAIKLKAVLIGIAQIKSFTHSVVAGAVERNVGSNQAAERVTKRRAIGIKNGDMK